MSASSLFRSILPDWRFVLAAAIIGAIGGALLYWMVAAGSEAIVVIQSGRVGGMEASQTRVSSQLTLERRGSPQMLLDKMQTPWFAKKVALEVGDTEIAADLPARQYGGSAALRVRAVGDGSLLEARIRAKTDDLALKLAGIIGGAAVTEDQATLSGARSLAQERIRILEKEREKLSALSDAMNSERDTPARDPTFLAKLIDLRTQINLVTESLWMIQAQLSPPLSQDTQIFSAPSVVRPFIRSWWIAASAGLLGGIALGYVISLALRRSLRSQPDPVDAGLPVFREERRLQAGAR